MKKPHAVFFLILVLLLLLIQPTFQDLYTPSKTSSTLKLSDKQVSMNNFTFVDNNGVINVILMTQNQMAYVFSFNELSLPERMIKFIGLEVPINRLMNGTELYFVPEQKTWRKVDFMNMNVQSIPRINGARSTRLSHSAILGKYILVTARNGDNDHLIEVVDTDKGYAIVESFPIDYTPTIVVGMDGLFIAYNGKLLQLYRLGYNGKIFRSEHTVVLEQNIINAATYKNLFIWKQDEYLYTIDYYNNFYVEYVESLLLFTLQYSN
jgi:hypothetical protein